jgi:hypothetical protein
LQRISRGGRRLQACEGIRRQATGRDGFIHEKFLLRVGECLTFFEVALSKFISVKEPGAPVALQALFCQEISIAKA